MKAILIKGAEMPDENGFLDIRVYGNGKVFMPCAAGEGSEATAEEIEIPDQD